MKRFTLALLVCLVVPAIAMAQDETPKVTVFGGYSLLRNGGNNSNAWDGQGTFNLNRYLGLTADVSGNYRNIASFSPLPGISPAVNQHLYTFLFGPTITGNLGRASVFGHALFGAARASSSAGVSLPFIGGLSTGVNSATAFAMAFGGGLDINLSRHFAIRPAQVDLVRTQFSPTDALTTGLSSSTSGAQNFLRYSGGIVFRF
jgi:opacity protein-like surface antigen